MSPKANLSDWRQSPAHLCFLSTFLKPRHMADKPAGIDWRLMLGEEPTAAVQRLVRDGALRRVSLRERLDYGLTTKALRELLREQGLPVSGDKVTLVNRLVERKWLIAEQATAHLTDVFRCTDYGLQLIEKHPVDENGMPLRPSTMSEEQLKRLLRWLLEQAALPVTLGAIGSVIGSFAYDWLRRLGEDVTPAPPDGEITIRVTRELALEFCYVPASYFLMGSANSDPDAYDSEKPQHRLHLPAYYVGKYPITNEQYRVFVRATGHREQRRWKNGRIPAGKEQHPVAYVRWSDAVAFCNWAARLAGKPLRLLTEAEWEKAARGPDGRRYPWGDTWRSSYSNSEHKVDATTPVGSYPLGVSPYGALDMIGNVWEWTSSAYQPYPYRADDGRERMSADESHVFRGGTYLDDAHTSRAAFRFRYSGFWYLFGFRVGWSAPFSLASGL
jgi:toxoflavin biosynthesis protein ToxD